MEKFIETSYGIGLRRTERLSNTRKKEIVRSSFGTFAFLVNSFEKEKITITFLSKKESPPKKF